jgi:ElaB/YqjD/DUF883 family membrane-anchored ribosome-binding protein
MSKNAADEAAELKREMEELGADPVADRIAATASAATDTVQSYAQELAAAIRRQPFAALAIGMAAAYMLGRLVSGRR